MGSIIDTLRVKGRDGQEHNFYPRTLVECITNKSGTKINVATEEFVLDQISNVNHLSREIVEEIPTVETALENVVYMYKVESETGTVYQEYQLIHGEIVLVGDTSIDLSDYVRCEELDKIINGETVVGKANEAIKSTFDGQNRNIVDTYLPKTGGKLSSFNPCQIEVCTSNANAAFDAIKYSRNNTLLGYLGFSDQHKPVCVHPTTQKIYPLLHSDNFTDYAATKESVDKIQTTKYASFSTPGWYRIAKFITSSQVKGGTANGLDLTIKRSFNNSNNEIHNIRLLSRYDKQEFVSMGSLSGGFLFTKIRYTYDETYAYIEIYYRGSVNNGCHFILSNHTDWEFIDAVATEETVEGVTVTTTYDIPANASPVNSVDLANGTYPIGAVGKNGYIAYPDDNDYFASIPTGKIRIASPIRHDGGVYFFKVIISDTRNSSGTVTYHIGGIPLRNDMNRWNTITAFSIGNPSASCVNLPVGFCHDGTNPIITIGNDDTEWGYVQVSITDVQCWGKNYDEFYKGWSISIKSDNSDLTILHTKTDPFIGANYLPIVNGIAGDGNAEIGFSVKGGGNATYLRFLDSSNALRGYIGVNASGELVFLKDIVRTLLHTGNKPSGTYTGNGSATARTISTGGIGAVLAIFDRYSAKNFMIITKYGAIGRKSNQCYTLSPDLINFNEGVLKITTDDENVNRSGSSYDYQVL